MDEDPYVLYEDHLTFTDYFNLVALLWRVPLALVGFLIDQAIYKLDAEK